jgi:hypothetical protein
MRNHGPSLLLSLLALACACESSNKPTEQKHDMHVDADAGSAPAASEEPAQLTYWKDMVPLFEQHCLSCHREGGIAPFRMDEYSAVKPLAKVIAHATRERTMPPWAVTSDGSCGNFADSIALNEEEIALISAWADSGAAEGEPGSIHVPELPSLDSATEFRTPEFFPEAQGGTLAESDEYRCFAVDKPEDAKGFVTGYEVLPGTAEIVHHVVAFFVDPDRKSTGENGQEVAMTNRERMQQLHDETPGRDGWPCFGAAGDGVEIDAVPVVWAPGQGVVSFPKDTGVPLTSRHQIVLQVHYNLSDVSQRGKSDSTRVRLRLAQDVKEVGIFMTEDPLLNSLYEDNPTTLPPGKTSTHYTWRRSAKDMDIGDMQGAKLYGVMPHMHGMGQTYEMTINQNGVDDQCAAQIDHWNFHWQRMYFYQKPYPITPDTQIAVDCEYDTSGAKEPVRPGWGTSNEMCLATLFMTVPRENFESRD